MGRPKKIIQPNSNPLDGSNTGYGGEGGNGGGGYTPSEITITKKVTIQPLTQEFGNGDLNVLRDKINEIIKSL